MHVLLWPALINHLTTSGLLCRGNLLMLAAARQLQNGMHDDPTCMQRTGLLFSWVLP